MKKNLRIFFLTFLIKIILLLFLHFLLKSNDEGRYIIGFSHYAGDAESYIKPVENFINEGSYYWDNGTGIKIRAGRTPYYGLIYQPFYLLFNKLIALNILVLLQVLLEVFSILLISRLAKEIFKTSISFWIVWGILTLNLYVSVFDLYIGPESFSTSLLCISLYYFILSLKRDSQKLLFISGLALAGCVVLRPHYSLIFVIYFFALFFSLSKSGKTIIGPIVKKSFILGISFLLIISPWVIRNYFIFQRIIPFQQDIYAGYGYDKAELAYRDFVNSFGGSIVHWDKRSAGSYFRVNEKPSEYSLPKYAIVKGYTMQNIENVRQEFFKFQKEGRTDTLLCNKIANEFNGFTELYKKNKPIMFFVGSNILRVKNLLIHSGSYYFPIINKNLILLIVTVFLKFTMSFIYYLILFAGLFGMLLYFRRTLILRILLSIAIVFLLLFAVIFKLTEWRYFTFFFAFAPIGVFAIIKEVLNTKAGIVMYNIFRRIYLLIPLKGKVFVILKKVYHPSEKISGYLKFKGKFKLNLKEKKSVFFYNNNQTISSILFWRGIYSYESESIKIWEYLSSCSDVIFDVGSNIGLFGILSKANNEKASVHCFEPLERNVNLINKNAELNNFKIKINQTAVYSSEGEVKIYDMKSDENTIASLNEDFVKMHRHHKEIVPIITKTLTLDKYIDSENLKKVDLVKIDVEGVEVDVLDGFKNGIINSRPFLLVEISSDQNGKLVQKFFENLEKPYLYCAVDEQIGPRLTSIISRQTKERNVLFVPKEKIELISDFLNKKAD